MGRPMIKYIPGQMIGKCKFIGNQRTEFLCGKYNSVGSFECPECGNHFDVMIGYIKMGTGSCGCYAKKISSEVHTKHGLTHSKEYNSWQSLRDRCNNPKNKGYSFYGAKGISVYPAWNDSFEEFLKDMGKAPSPIHTVDRYPNQKGNYEPGNCRWATPEQQNNNKSNNRVVEYNGESKTLMQWSKSLDISYQALQQRLNKKWPIEDVFNVPVIRGAANRWRNYKKEKV